MKSAGYMKETSISEMERIASDGAGRAPKNLEISIEELTDSLEALRRMEESDKRSSVFARRIADFAAVAVILIAAVFGFSREPRLKDTYTDPMLAYAEAEKALMVISEALSGGALKTAEAIEAFEAPKEIINDIVR